MPVLKIGTISGLLGIHPQSLRRLELQGKIPPAQRDRWGHRVFSEEDIERIRAGLQEKRRRREKEPY